MDTRQKKGRYASSKVVRFAWALLFVALTFIILSINYLPDRISLQVGDKVENNVYYSGSATSFISNTLTQEAQNEAAQQVEQIYRYDDTVVPDVQDNIDSMFAVFLVTKNNSSLTTLEEQIARAQESLPDTISEESMTYALQSSDTVLNQLANYLKEVVKTAYGSGVAQTAVASVEENVLETIASSNYKASARNLLTQIGESLVYNPNLLQDQVATMAAVEEAIAQVAPVRITVRPGELVLAAGETVTDADLETLNTLGLLSDSSTSLPYVGLIVFVVFFFILFGIFLRLYCRDVWEDSSKILLLGLLLTTTLLLGKVLALLNISTRWETDALMGFLIPAPACAMLVAALFDHKVALFSTIFIGICTAIIGGGQVGYAFAAICGGIVGIYQVSKMDQRTKYVTSALYLGCTYAIVIIAWGLMWSYSWEYIGIGIIMGLINGLLSAILTIGSLPFWEGAFGITTEIRLLELCNFNQPLLKQLMVEAPGTYQHSILVGNLAEAAASAVGANPLLVRVGSYYHDVGKLKRPYFFIENQGVGENPHNKLQPTLSTLIISSHPKEGKEMAKEYKLPDAVLDIIEQHHGTSLAGFFYKKALDSGMEDVKEEDFRYPGPKPQSMEAAIVLLADSVQAATQALQNNSAVRPTKGQIDGKIREIIRGKFEDGQLDESPLTFRDLDIIANAFSRVLAGVSHTRISYPAQIEKEWKKKRGAKNAGSDSQSSEKDLITPGVAEPTTTSSQNDAKDGKEPPAAEKRP